ELFQWRMIRYLLSHSISVYAVQSNLVSAVGVVNDLLAEPLILQSTKVLVDVYHEDLFKLVVFVPVTHMEAVLDALNKAGAGHIGNYSHCTFQTQGQGTFKQLEGTNPFIGSKGELEKVNEVKIETIVPHALLSKSVQKMIKAHP